MAKKKIIEEPERYVLIIAGQPIQYYTFLFLLQCRSSDSFVIKATDSQLAKAEQLLSLYSNVGIIEEDRIVNEEIFVKGKKKFRANVNIIKCRKIGALEK